MPNGGVTKETFLKSDTDAKLSILFDQQQDIIYSVQELRDNESSIHLHCQDQWSSCDTRFKKLERTWYKLAGAMVLAATVAPILVTVALKYLFNIL